VGGIRDRCSHDAAGHDVLESTVHGLGEAPYPTATLVADVIQKANQSVVLWRPLRRRHGDHAADRDPEQVLGSSFGGSGDLRYLSRLIPLCHLTEQVRVRPPQPLICAAGAEV